MTPLKSYHARCLCYVNVCKYSESKLACKWLLRPAVPLKQDEVVEQRSSLLLPLSHYVYLWSVCEADLLSRALKWSYHPCTWADIDILVCVYKMIFLPAPWWRNGGVAQIKPGFMKYCRVVLYRCGFHRNVSPHLPNYSTSSTERLKGSKSKL